MGAAKSKLHRSSVRSVDPLTGRMSSMPRRRAAPRRNKGRLTVPHHRLLLFDARKETVSEVMQPPNAVQSTTIPKNTRDIVSHLARRHPSATNAREQEERV
jgi:hypothetical protein